LNVAHRLTFADFRMDRSARARAVAASLEGAAAREAYARALVTVSAGETLMISVGERYSASGRHPRTTTCLV
jgi:hypothetical protein